MNNIIVAKGSTGVVSQFCKRVLNEQGGSVLAGAGVVLVFSFFKEMMVNGYCLHFKKGDMEFDFEKNCAQS